MGKEERRLFQLWVWRKYQLRRTTLRAKAILDSAPFPDVRFILITANSNDLAALRLAGKQRAAFSRRRLAHSHGNVGAVQLFGICAERSVLVGSPGPHYGLHCHRSGIMRSGGDGHHAR